MDNFADEDIILFLHSYSQNILENPLLNSKIPMWVEYLKTKKHYRENGLEEDYFFKKRFMITKDDLLTIHKLIDRVKRGKGLTRQSKTSIQGNISSSSQFGAFSLFNENEDYEGKEKQFELLGQVESAMNDYYKKMKKHQQKKDWKKNHTSSDWEPNGCVSGEPDRYYTEDINSSRPQIEFDVQDFAKTKLYNMSKTNIINQIDNITNILDHNNLITNEFDTEYKRAVPNLVSNKKGQYCSSIETLTQEGKEDILARPGQDISATRYWQDMDIINARGATRGNTAVPNNNPFEYQFQYLDGNYNRVPDPRIVGTSSRLENKTHFRR